MTPAIDLSESTRALGTVRAPTCTSIAIFKEALT